MTNADMESVSWARIAFAFVTVFGLIALMGFVLKYIKTRGLTLPGAATNARRMQIVESLTIDPRRRLVIVRCDGVEHLLLLGGNQDVVIEANLDKHAGGMQTKSGG